MHSNCKIPKKPKRPILRWAGGKKHLVPHLTKLLPDSCGRYIEPMVGGGALFFSITPQDSLLADVNDDLINFYRVLRDGPDKLIPKLLRLRASSELYYSMRAKQPRSDVGKAVRFAYLNRLCWNGLYRVNRRGEFNVPIGSRLPAELWNAASLWAAVESLQGVRLESSDFASILDLAQSGDLVFVDPPYRRGANGSNGFNRYTSGRFTMEDHHRLATKIMELDKRGVRILLALANQRALMQLYPNTLRKRVVASKSLVSGHSKGRRPVREAILFNFDS